MVRHSIILHSMRLELDDGHSSKNMGPNFTLNLKKYADTNSNMIRTQRY